ncbi:MAG: cellulase family glycosylhydrolase [Acidobacteriota bacterium]|jgi:hypothetical protein|nr:cellulase family glycosylhydrolase [Acidobacteriota bacterium]
MMKRCFSLCCVWLGLTVTLLAANASPSPYGLNVHLADNAGLKRVVEAGIAWIRIDINWNNCEPRKGVLQLADVDRVVAFARKNGLSVLAVLAYTPGWANNERGINYPADQPADWRSFVRVIVNRYQADIKYWSVWNEPNVPDFFASGKDAFMAQVWNPAAEVIRKQDPGAFIVGPDLAHLTSEGQEWFLWMKYILLNSASGFDIISHHLYDSRGGQYVFELLETGEPLIPAVVDLVAELGFSDRPFWLTETGWSTRRTSEDVQAQNYLETLQLRSSRGFPDKLFFYELRDDLNPDISSWGILRSDGSAKPAYGVYRSFISNGDPGGNTDPIPEEESEDCYAERLIPATARPQVISPLRGLRRMLLSGVAGGRFWVEAYSHHGTELARISLQDSRLFHTGNRLMRHLAFRLQCRQGDFWSTPLPPGLIADARHWLTAALTYPLADDLRRLLLRAQCLTRTLPARATPLDVVAHRRF